MKKITKLSAVLIAAAILCASLAGCGKKTDPKELLLDSLEKTFKYVVGEELIETVENAAKNGSFAAELNAEIPVDLSDKYPIGKITVTDPAVKAYFGGHCVVDLCGNIGRVRPRISLYTDGKLYIASAALTGKEEKNFGFVLPELSDKLPPSYIGGLIGEEKSEKIADAAVKAYLEKVKIAEIAEKYRKCAVDAFFRNSDISAKRKGLITNVTLEVTYEDVKKAASDVIVGEFIHDAQTFDFLSGLLGKETADKLFYKDADGEYITEPEQVEAILDKYLSGYGDDGLIFRSVFGITAGMIVSLDGEAVTPKGESFLFGYNVVSKDKMSITFGRNGDVRKAEYVTEKNGDGTVGKLMIDGNEKERLTYAVDTGAFTLGGDYAEGNGNYRLANGDAVLTIDGLTVKGKDAGILRSLTVRSYDPLPSMPAEYTDVLGMSEEDVRDTAANMIGELVFALIFS